MTFRPGAPSIPIFVGFGLEGVWDRVLAALRMQMRTRQGRNAEPSAAIIDSQSIKTSAVRGTDQGLRYGEKNLGTQTARLG